MTPNVARGPAFAKWLVDNLTDLEFELLLRDRIKMEFARAFSMVPNLCESVSICTFQHRWNDDSQWTVRIGENYRKEAQQEGQVLSVTVRQAVSIMDMKAQNTMTRLLPSPNLDTEE